MGITTVSCNIFDTKCGAMSFQPENYLSFEKLLLRTPKSMETVGCRALCVSEALQNAKCPGATAFLTFRAPQKDLFKAERIFRLKAHSVEKGAPIIYFETAIPLSK